MADPITLLVGIGAVGLTFRWIRKKQKEDEERERKQQSTEDDMSRNDDLVPLYIPPSFSRRREGCWQHSPNPVDSCARCSVLSYYLAPVSEPESPVTVLARTNPSFAYSLMFEKIRGDNRVDFAREALSAPAVVEMVRGRRVRSLDVEIGVRGFFNRRPYIHVDVEEER